MPPGFDSSGVPLLDANASSDRPRAGKPRRKHARKKHVPVKLQLPAAKHRRRRAAGLYTGVEDLRTVLGETLTQGEEATPEDGTVLGETVAQGVEAPEEMAVQEEEKNQQEDRDQQEDGKATFNNSDESIDLCDLLPPDL